jgi:hypothetical protein
MGKEAKLHEFITLATEEVSGQLHALTLYPLDRRLAQPQGIIPYYITFSQFITGLVCCCSQPQSYCSRCHGTGVFPWYYYTVKIPILVF